MKSLSEDEVKSLMRTEAYLYTIILNMKRRKELSDKDLRIYILMMTEIFIQKIIMSGILEKMIK